MGMVYRARDAELERDVALKILKPELGLDAERAKRFLREAKAAGRLRHPNVISIFDVGIHDGAVFVVTELLEGETLRARLEKGPIPLEQALAIGRQIVAALEVAHAAGIVHRDLKPENVFLAATGEAKLLDFGVAKILEPPMGGSVAGSASTVSLQTEPGAVIGTVGYMAPEQLRGEEVAPSADVFSFGAIFYEMVSGLRAFGGDTPVERLAAILKESPPDICDGDARDVAKVLREIVRKCLAKDARDRYPSAAELAADLDRAREGGEVAGTETSKEAARVGPPGARKAALVAAVALGIIGVPIAFIAGRCSPGSSVLEAAPASSSSAPNGGDASKPATPGTEAAPKFTRLTFRSGGIASARFAPDGMTVAYGAFFGAEPLRVHVVRTDNAASRPLEIEGDVLSISNNGEIAVSLERRLAWWPAEGTLAVAPLMSGAARPLIENVQDVAFEKDGETFVVARHEAGRVVVERPKGKTIFETDGWVSSLRIDPSGERIAFLHHPYATDSAGGVTVIDKEGKATALVEGWMDLNGLAWSKDGSEVWFSGASERGPLEIAAVGLDRQLRRVFQGPGRVVLHDIAPDGRALVTVEDHRAIAMVHDAAGDRDISVLDQSALFDLSADGKTALISEQSAAGKTGYDIYLRPTNGGPPLLLGSGLATSIAGDGAVVLRTDLGSSTLSLLPAGAGETKRLPAEGFSFTSTELAASGKRIAALASRDKEGVRPWIFPIEASGSPRAVGPVGRWVDVASTADDALVVAMTRGGEVWAFPADGAAASKDAGKAAIALPPHHVLVGAAGGHKINVLRRGARPGVVLELDVDDGSLEEQLRIQPPDQAGFVEVATFAKGPRDMYAYTYFRQLATLFVVEGLR